MTVVMRVMSAGAAYRYLLESVVVGDGGRDVTAPLIRYYAEKGAPPGCWYGSGVVGLARGRIREGEEMTETQETAGEGRAPHGGSLQQRKMAVAQALHKLARPRVT